MIEIGSGRIVGPISTRIFVIIDGYGMEGSLSGFHTLHAPSYCLIGGLIPKDDHCLRRMAQSTAEQSRKEQGWTRQSEERKAQSREESSKKKKKKRKRKKKEKEKDYFGRW